MNDSPEPDTGKTPDARAGIGAAGEQLAAEHLIRRGYEIVERNFRTRFGELDIIALTDRTIVFVEVKTRMTKTGQTRSAVRNPLESVHLRKQRKVRRMAGRWLAERTDRPRAGELRFDAIGVTLDETGALLRLDHLEGVF